MFRGARLKNRPVISAQTAQKLGIVYDIEINEADGTVTSIIVVRGGMLSRILGMGEIIIPWKNIAAVGDRYVLTDIYSTDVK